MADVYVYVISAFGIPVKVGFAADVEKRLRQLQTGNPDLLRVHGSVAVGAGLAPAVERTAHRKLADHHHRGEWFFISAEHAIQTVIESEAEVTKAFLDAPKNADDALLRLAVYEDVHPYAPSAAQAYRHARQSPGSTIKLAPMDRALVAGGGLIGQQLFVRYIIDRGMIEMAFRDDPLGLIKATARLAASVNALAEHYYQSRQPRLTDTTS